MATRNSYTGASHRASGRYRPCSEGKRGGWACQRVRNARHCFNAHLMTPHSPLKMRLTTLKHFEVPGVLMRIMVVSCLKMKRNKLSIASTNNTNSSNSSNHRCQRWQQGWRLLGITRKLQCSWSIVTNKESPKVVAATGVTTSSHQWFTPIIPSKSIIIIVCHTITTFHRLIWVADSDSQNSLHTVGWVWYLIRLFTHRQMPVTNPNILLRVEFQTQALNSCTITSKTKIKLTESSTSHRLLKVPVPKPNKELRLFYPAIIPAKWALCPTNTTRSSLNNLLAIRV